VEYISFKLDLIFSVSMSYIMVVVDVKSDAGVGSGVGVDFLF
jgi:hypothetical protein